jgi:hypothetical protein
MDKGCLPAIFVIALFCAIIWVVFSVVHWIVGSLVIAVILTVFIVGAL